MSRVCEVSGATTRSGRIVSRQFKRRILRNFRPNLHKVKVLVENLAGTKRTSLTIKVKARMIPAIKRGELKSLLLRNVETLSPRLFAALR